MLPGPSFSCMDFSVRRKTTGASVSEQINLYLALPRKPSNNSNRALARDLGRPIYAVVSPTYACLFEELCLIKTSQDLRNHGDSPHDPHHDYSSMADDVAGFIEEHNLQDTTLIGHSMGAKTAMTLALKRPDMITDIVAVDNAPIDAALLSIFGKYIQGMKKIEEAGITKQSDADMILKDYEEVCYNHNLSTKM